MAVPEGVTVTDFCCKSLLLLQVLIDVETYEYFSVHSKGSEGVLVLVQHYRDIPLMRKESFVLGPGTGK